MCYENNYNSASSTFISLEQHCRSILHISMTTKRWWPSFWCWQELVYTCRWLSARKNVTQLIRHWSYVFLARTHPYVTHWCAVYSILYFVNYSSFYNFQDVVTSLDIHIQCRTAYRVDDFTENSSVDRTCLHRAPSAFIDHSHANATSHNAVILFG